MIYDHTSIETLLATANAADDCATYIVIATDGLAARQWDQLTGWCMHQPIPVIAVSEDTAPHDPFDLVVHPERLDAVTAAISANPAASSVLVQATRTSGQLATPDALRVESLAYAALQGGAEHKAWLAAQPGRQSVRVNEPVVLSRDDGHLDITLNCPANRNALSASMRDALSDAFRLAISDDTITTLALRGNGPAFCAGGDLSEFGTQTDTAVAHAIRMRRMPAQFLAGISSRTTAHLHGACIGAGIELPAFCHHITARKDTVLRLPEVGMGLIPGAGGCVSIPRRIGRQRTNLLAILGQEIDAATALKWGLVDELVG